MNTLKFVNEQIQRPGMLVATKIDEWDEKTDLRPKESQLLQSLMEYNQQTHLIDQVQIRNRNHAIHYFNVADSSLVLEKVAKNRKLKLKDFLIGCLAKAAAKLELNNNIQHIDLQKEESDDYCENSKFVAFDLGKVHRRKLDSNIHLSMLPPLIEDKISVSFVIFADKLSLAVNGPDEMNNIILEMWIREINKELFS